MTMTVMIMKTLVIICIELLRTLTHLTRMDWKTVILHSQHSVYQQIGIYNIANYVDYFVQLIAVHLYL